MIHKHACLLATLLFFLPAHAVLPGDNPGVPAPIPGDRPPRVLVLNSYHQGYRWTDSIVQTLFRELSDREVDFMVEYMDSVRNPSERLYPSLYGLFHQKYRLMQPDLIIAADDTAYRFLLSFHGKLFPEIPVVFCGINSFDDRELENRPLFTGVLEQVYFRETIELMLELHPDTRSIYYLVDNSSTSRNTLGTVREIFRSLPGVDLRVLQGSEITTAQMYQAVSNLPPDSLVLTTPWMMDWTGSYTPSEAVLRHVADASPVPVYGLIDLGLGHGIVGGMLDSARNQGREAARIARLILDGEHPSRIPIVRDTGGSYLFDHRQLRRHDISRSSLPGGSVLINEPFSFYRTYRHIIWTVVAVMLLQTATIVVLISNIVLRRRAEALLQESREDLAITLDSIGDAVIATDPEGRIVRMNPKAEELTGWSIDEVRGLHHHDRFPLFLENRSEAEVSLVDQVLRENRTVASDLPLQLRRRDGEELQVSENAAPIRDAAGQIRGAVAVLRDTTEKRRLEEQLQQSQKMEAIGQLAGGVAHDFNNLLTGVLAYASLIRDSGQLSGEEAGYVNGILETAQRAGSITRQLLEFSRQGAFTPRPVEVHEIIRETAELLHHTFDRRIRIFQDLCAPRSTVFGDATQISQVLLNVCINARDAMPEGGELVIATDLQEPDRDDGQEPLPAPGMDLRIRICDSGTGIPERILNRIFDPFFTTKEAGKGTGMGLASAYGIVHNHNGSISAENRPEGGTCFSILLPLQEQQVVERPDDVVEPEKPARRQTESSLILLVEDERAVRESLSRLLTSMGYRVHAVPDGEEAAGWYEENRDRTHLVILDINMPVLDGFETFRRMKRIHPGMKSIIVTGFAVSRKTTSLLREGALAVLSKPFTREELSDALREVLAP